MNDKLNRWERFLDSLSTEGGHIILWILGMCLGMVCVKIGIPYGHEIMVGSMSGLGISLKSGARSNATRRETVAEATRVINGEAHPEQPEKGGTS